MNVYIIVIISILCSGAVAAEQAKLLLIGQSYWSAGGRADCISHAFFSNAGYEGVKVKIQRGHPRAYYQERMFQENRQNELPHSHRKASIGKQARRDMDGVRAKVSDAQWKWIVFHGLSSGPFEERGIQRLDEYVRYLQTLRTDMTLFCSATWPKDQDTKKFATIKKTYRYLAKTHDIGIAPVGMAFERVGRERPDIRLYRSDTDGHPSVWGQYLQCCVIYATVTERSPVGLPAKIMQAVAPSTGHVVDFSSEVALYLQNTAWIVYTNELQLQKDPAYGSLTDVLKDPFLDAIQYSAANDSTETEIALPAGPYCREDVYLYPKANEKKQHVLTRITTKNADQTPHIITEYIKNKLVSYSECIYMDGKIQQKIKKNSATQKVFSKQVYSYKGSAVQTMEMFDSTDNSVGKKVYTFASETDELPEQYVLYGNDGLQIEEEKYEYKNGRVAKKTELSASGSIVAIYGYEYYENGYLKYEKYSSNNGSLIRQDEYLYNTDGTLKEIISTNRKGTVTDKKTFLYDEQKRVVSEKTFRLWKQLDLRREKVTSYCPE